MCISESNLHVLRMLPCLMALALNEHSGSHRLLQEVDM
jgi:hypothetical protein